MLIGLNGRAQVGKDTVYAVAADLVTSVPVERKAYADALYASAAAALGVTPATLRYWRTRDVRLRVWPASTHQVSIREYLQRFGTEGHRELFGQDFWVDRLDLSDHEGRLVFVTDVRFPNEARHIRANGGIVVKVVGPPDIYARGDAHASEADLPGDLVDHVLINDQRGDRYAALTTEIGRMLDKVGGPQ